MLPSAFTYTFTRAPSARSTLTSQAAPYSSARSTSSTLLPSPTKARAAAEATDAERATVREAMVERAFGAAGEQVLIEEFLEGEEVSLLALVDGQHIVLLSSAQDHKRVFDDDRGPNTGGMGAYSPAPVIPDALLPAIEEQVFRRTLAELKRRGIVYKGVLYAGLMMTRNGPRVLEFNCRFGDPETQVILPRIA